MRNPAIGTRKAHPCRVSLQALPMTEEDDVNCRCREGPERAGPGLPCGPGPPSPGPQTVSYHIRYLGRVLVAQSLSPTLYKDPLCSLGPPPFAVTFTDASPGPCLRALSIVATPP